MTLLRYTDVRPDEEINKLLDATIDQANKEFEPLEYEGFYPTAGYGIAELAPYHIPMGGAGTLSSDFWGASIAASNTWQDWWNVTMTDMAYIIHTGLFDLEPTPIITHIRPRPGGEDMPGSNIEQMFALDVARIFFEKPYSVKPNNTYVMRIMAKNATTERIGAQGYCLAKRSYLILEP